MILLFFFIDYASERNENLLSNCRAQLILCKITLFFRKMQGIIGKCLRVKEITEKAKKKGFFVVTIKIFMYFCKNTPPGSSPASNNLGEGLTGTALQR